MNMCLIMQDRFNQGKRPYLALFLVLSIFLVQGSLFLSGYRLTADDVVFDNYMMMGSERSWEFTKLAAFDQGRIVHFFDVPVMLLGGHYSSSLIFRIFYVSLYFLNFVLLGKYVNLMSGSKIGWLVVLVLLSLHPLDYFHLAPNSYPLHMTLPVMLILISRIGLFYSRQFITDKVSTAQLLWLLLMFIGMLHSEYGFSFAVALIFAEFVVRILRARRIEKSLLRAGLRSIRHPFVVWDIMLVVAFLTAYLIFRNFFPSAYSGNQIGDGGGSGLFLKTLFGHIYGGTALAAYARHGHEYFAFLRQMGYFAWGQVLVVFSAALCSFCLIGATLLRGKECKKASKPRELNASWGMFIALCCALIVTVPVAMTAKYQGWCTEWHSCIYIDSRISYLFVGVFLSIVVYGALQLFSVNELLGRACIIGLGLLIAFASSLTFINNLRVEESMRQVVSGWERADRLACLSDYELRKIEPLIERIVEPVSRISFHPDFDVAGYWEKYIKFRRGVVDCDGQDSYEEFFFPAVKFGERMSFVRNGDGFKFPMKGWSTPEDWGVWSNGKVSDLLFPLKEVRKVSIEANVFLAKSYPTQRVIVEANGIRVADLTLSASFDGVFDVILPDAVRERVFESGWLKLELFLPDAVSPKSLGLSEDSRELAVGLRSVAFY